MAIISAASLLLEHARRVYGIAEIPSARALFAIAEEQLRCSASIPKAAQDALLAELYKQLIAS